MTTTDPRRPTTPRPAPVQSTASPSVPPPPSRRRLGPGRWGPLVAIAAAGLVMGCDTPRPEAKAGDDAFKGRARPEVEQVLRTPEVDLLGPGKDRAMAVSILDFRDACRSLYAEVDDHGGVATSPGRAALRDHPGPTAAWRVVQERAIEALDRGDVDGAAAVFDGACVGIPADPHDVDGPLLEALRR